MKKMLLCLLTASCIAASKLPSLDYGLASDPGKRYAHKSYPMEDRSCCKVKGDHAFFAVFDGHGGNEVADFLKETMYSMLKKELQFTTAPAAFSTICSVLDAQVCNQFESAGSTATMALIKNETLCIANIGDSRTAVFSPSGTLVFETVDHKTTCKAERARIKAAGGTIRQNYVQVGLSGLAVTRSFGDKLYKQYVPAIADVTEIPLYQVGFVVLASDGLWDLLTTKEVAEIITHSPSPQKAAESLLKAAQAKKVDDNITVIVVKVTD